MSMSMQMEPMKYLMSALCGLLCSVGAVLAQQKISILGDSYSTFYGYVTPATNACWYGVPGEKKENDVTSVEETWWCRFLQAYGYVLERNNSYSGATVCHTGYDGADYSDRSFVTRMTDLGHPDIILVFGGTNDSWAGVPVGEFQYEGWQKEDLYEFRPAFCCLMDYLVMHYPDAAIYNITNTELSKEVESSMDEVCRHYGITNIRLHDIDKQWGHPSVKGMQSICCQVGEVVSSSSRQCQVAHCRDSLRYVREQHPVFGGNAFHFEYDAFREKMKEPWLGDLLKNILYR